MLVTCFSGNQVGLSHYAIPMGWLLGRQCVLGTRTRVDLPLDHLILLRTVKYRCEKTSVIHMLMRMVYRSGACRGGGPAMEGPWVAVGTGISVGEEGGGTPVSGVAAEELAPWGARHAASRALSPPSAGRGASSRVVW